MDSHMKAILEARAARKRGTKKKTIPLDGIRCVARPEQLADATQPTMALVTGQELLQDASLLDLENDPIFKQAKPSSPSTSSKHPMDAVDATTEKLGTNLENMAPTSHPDLGIGPARAKEGLAGSAGTDTDRTETTAGPTNSQPASSTARGSDSQATNSPHPARPSAPDPLSPAQSTTTPDIAVQQSSSIEEGDIRDVSPQPAGIPQIQSTEEASRVGDHQSQEPTICPTASSDMDITRVTNSPPWHSNSDGEEDSDDALEEPAETQHFAFNLEDDSDHESDSEDSPIASSANEPLWLDRFLQNVDRKEDSEVLLQTERNIDQAERKEKENEPLKPTTTTDETMEDHEEAISRQAPQQRPSIDQTFVSTDETQAHIEQDEEQPDNDPYQSDNLLEQKEESQSNDSTRHTGGNSSGEQSDREPNHMELESEQQPEQSKKRPVVSEPESILPNKRKKQQSARPPQEQPQNMGRTAEKAIFLDSDDDDEVEIVEQPTKNHAAAKPSKPHLVHVTTIVPKYLKPNGDIMLTKKILSLQILMPFRVKHCPPKISTAAFRVKLMDIPDDPESYRLSVKGPKLIAAAFGNYLETWIRKQLEYQQVQDILADDTRREVDVSLPKEKFLAAWKKGFIHAVSSPNIQEMCDPCQSTSPSLGLWVDFESRGQGGEAVRELFEPHLGTRTIKSPGLAVVVMRVAGVQYETKGRWEQVKQHLEEFEEREIRVTLNIDGIDMEKDDGEHASLPPAEIHLGSVMEMSSLNRSVTRPSPSSSAKGSATGEHASSGGQNTAWRTNDKFNQWTLFKRKFKEVYDIEYHRSDIAYQTVMKLMWEQHKLAFGADRCDDDCPCALELPYMTEKVTDVFIRRGKNPDWLERGSPVGFVNHFVPYYQNLVIEQYPDDEPAQTLERLKKMWTKHIQQVRFGSFCGKGCECKSGWSSVFFNGDIKALTSSTRGRRRASLTADTQQRVPRKRPRTEIAHSPVAKQLAEFRARSSLMPGLQKIDVSTKDASSIHTKKQGNLTAAQQNPDSFRVYFDSHMPLGFFCVTETVGNQKVCKIVSVDPFGECQKSSSFVRTGTRVEAVERTPRSQPARFPVQGHEELHRHYEGAKFSTRPGLTIYFNNTGVPPSFQIPAGNHEWADGGKWLGEKHTEGWAGGAEVGQPGAPTQAVAFAVRRPDSGVWRPSNNQRDDHFTGARRHILLPPPMESVLRGPVHREENKSRPKQKRRISFANLQSERTFPDPSTATNVKLKESESWVAAHLPPNEEHDKSVDEASAKAALVAASKLLQDRSLSQLIRLLQSGKIHTGQTFEKSNFFDYALARTKGEGRVRPLLKIFKQAGEAISIAQGLKTWKKFNIQIVKITDFSLTPEGQNREGLGTIKGRIFSAVNGKEKKLPSIPPMTATRVMDYGAGNAALPSYSLYYNPADRHFLRIVLCSGKVRSAEARGARVNLPFLQISMQDLAEGCLSMDEPITVTKEFNVGSSGLVEAGIKIQLAVTRIKLPADFHWSKIEAGSQELKNAIDWIQHFNSDNRHDGHQLTGQICGKDGFSLLHAGIAFSRPDFVKKLLDLGANPCARSGAGKAVVYARRAAMFAEERSKISEEKIRIYKQKQYDIHGDGAEFDSSFVNSMERRQERLSKQSSRQKKIAAAVLDRSKAHRFGRDASYGGAGDEFVGHAACHVADSGANCFNPSVPSSTPPERLRPTETTVSPSQVGAKEVSEVHLFVASVDPNNSMDSTWVCMDAASKAFYEKLGHEDVTAFREARAAASSRGLVQWGIQDEDTFGGDVELSSPDQIDQEAAEEAFICLTEEGKQLLAARPCPRPIEESNEQAGSPGLDSNSSSNKEQYEVHLFVTCIDPSNSMDSYWVCMDAASKLFYEKLGREDDALFCKARTTATSRGLVQWGAQDEDTFGGDVELSSPGKFHGTAEEAFLCLTEEGKQLLAAGVPPKPIEGSNEQVAPESFFPKAAIMDSTGSRNKEEDDELYLFVESVDPANSMDSDWVCMDAAAKAFYEKLGREDETLFRNARKTATSRGLIQWGIQDKDTFGGDVELSSPHQFDAAAEEALLCLTEEGKRLLAAGAPLIPTGADCQNVAPTTFSTSTTLNGTPTLAAKLAPSAVSTSQAPSLRSKQPGAQLVRDYQRCPDMKAFLDCLADDLSQGDHQGWVRMRDLGNAFAGKYSPPATVGPTELSESVTADYKEWCQEASRRKLLLCGRADESGVQLCPYHQVLEHSSDAWFKLTDEGSSLVLAGGNVESNNLFDWKHGNVESSLRAQQPPQRMACNHEMATRGSGITSSSHNNNEHRSLHDRAVSVPSGHEEHHTDDRSRNSHRSVDQPHKQRSSNREHQPDDRSHLSHRSADNSGYERRSSYRFERRSSHHREHESHHGRRHSSTRYNAEEYDSDRVDDRPAVLVKTKEWFLLGSGQSREECQYFRSTTNVHCRYGRKCRFAHIQPILGKHRVSKAVESCSHLPHLEASHVRFGERFYDEGGRQRREFTAAYRDPMSKIYYRSAGGRCVVDSETDLCWYPTKDDAEYALQAQYLASRDSHGPR